MIYHVSYLPVSLTLSFNFSPNNTILGWSKLKAFADDNVNVTQKLKFVLGRIEKNIRYKKILVTGILSLSKNVFKSLLFKGYKKSGPCVQGLRKEPQK